MAILRFTPAVKGRLTSISGLKSAPRVDGELRKEIAAVAHQIWQSKGCPDDSSEADWSLAERLLSRNGRSAKITSIESRRRARSAFTRQFDPGAA
jgi:hypothetical protein